MLIDAYRWQTVRIVEIIHEAVDAVTLVTERPTDYVFLPGQHAIMRVTFEDGSTRIRQYSFAQSPSHTHLFFTITRSPGGDVSSWCIDHATTKSTIELSQAFTGPLQEDLTQYASVGMIAGGSGIVPMMGHVRTLRHDNSSTHISLIYSTRSPHRCYKSELQSSHENEIICVRETDNDERFTKAEILKHMQGCEIILLCGSRQFVTRMQSLCNDTYPDIEMRAEAFSLV